MNKLFATLDKDLWTASQKLLGVVQSDPPPRWYVGTALEAAYDMHSEGDVGNTNDIIEAFLSRLCEISGKHVEYPQSGGGC